MPGHRRPLADRRFGRAIAIAHSSRRLSRRSPIMIEQLVPVIAPVLITAGLGFAWARYAGSFDTGLITSLVFYIGSPSLVLATFIKIGTLSTVFAELALAALLSIVVCAAAGAVFLKLAGLSLRTYLPSVMFANTGNLGLPLALFAFGEPGLALGIGIMAVNSVVQMTIGPLIVSGEMSAARVAKTPVIWAVAAAVAIMLTGAKAPLWFVNTVQLLSGMTIPMMLLALGFSLARLKVKSLGRSFALGVLRLVLGFASAMLLVWIFGFTGAARGVLIIQCSMPVAVFQYLFAQMYNRAPEEIAGTVLMSTVLSFLTLPVLLLVAL
jgi:predicted permease